MSRSKRRTIKQPDVWTEQDEWSWNKIVRALQEQYEYPVYEETIIITTKGEHIQNAREEHKRQESIRECIVSEDDITDVKIQLGLCKDVSEFINELD